MACGTVVALDDLEYARLLRNRAGDGTVGGQVYDATIVACTRLAGVEVLVTFNERHVRRSEGEGLTIEAP